MAMDWQNELEFMYDDDYINRGIGLLNINFKIFFKNVSKNIIHYLDCQ